MSSRPIKRFDPDEYGPAFGRLLQIDRRRALDAGSPDVQSRPTLERLSVEAAFGDAKIADRDMANCCLAGIWLLHDFLDESHALSQQIETPSGSFWHAIMHRREGDFGNSKYWWRRVGPHAAFEPLAERAAELTAQGEMGFFKLIASGSWDPFAFVNACQAAQQGNRQRVDFCRDIQQAEWELLFDHCYHAAVQP